MPSSKYHHVPCVTQPWLPTCEVAVVQTVAMLNGEEVHHSFDGRRVAHNVQWLRLHLQSGQVT